MQQLPQELIEKALASTGKTTDNVEVFTGNSIDFSIEKFCFYLLSPEFIENYHKYMFTKPDVFYSTGASKFGEAIYEYQKGNSQPLVNLLSKI